MKEQQQGGRRRHTSEEERWEEAGGGGAADSQRKVLKKQIGLVLRCVVPGGEDANRRVGGGRSILTPGEVGFPPCSSQKKTPNETLHHFCTVLVRIRTYSITSCSPRHETVCFPAAKITF